MSDAVERLVNLALYLAAAHDTVTREQVRTEVAGYPEDQSDEAFLRMFERDKDDLKNMGFAIEIGAEGHYRLDAGATFAQAIDLTPTETAAVRIAASALVDDPAFPFADDLRLALAKLSGEARACELTAAARTADEEPGRQGETVALLSSAVTARKRVTFGYTNSLGATAPHEVEPYGLFVHDGRWYLVARDVAKDDVRTYTIARTEAPTTNAERPKHPDFERPADFDVSTFVCLPFQYGPNDAEFTAEVVIAADAAWRARALAAGQGELAETPDGSLSWRVPARSRKRVLRFVIEHGPGLQVVGPPELVRELEAGLREAEAVHG